MPQRREESQHGAPGARLLARSIWSGTITFGLVTIPVELYSARRSADSGPPLRMLSPDGVPLARQYVCPADGTPLTSDDIERAYEVAKDQFVIVTDEELSALAPRRSREIELARFVNRDAIDARYFVHSYFLIPGGEQTKAYRLLAETMEASGRAAIATFVMHGKAYAAAIFADQGILRAETLRFVDEVRSADTVGLPSASADDIARSRVEQMVETIGALSSDKLDEAELVDPTGQQLLELARAKYQKGEDVLLAPPAWNDSQHSGAAAAPGEEHEGARDTGAAVYASEQSGGESDDDHGTGASDGDRPGGAGRTVDLMALLKQRLGGGAGAQVPAKPVAKASRDARSSAPTDAARSKPGGTRAHASRKAS